MREALYYTIPRLSHGEEFAVALDIAIARFEILDQFDEMLPYPQCVLDYYGDQVPPLFELKRYAWDPWKNVPEVVTNPPSMRAVAWALLDYQDVDDEIRELLEAIDQEYPGVFVRSDEHPAVHEEVRRLLGQRIKLLHYAAVLNFQTSLTEIEMKAEHRGDETAMLQLAQLDKSAIYAPWFKRRIIQRQYAGDWEFFDKLGKALAKPVLGGSGHWHKAVVIAGYFWREYFSQPEWPINRIFRLFKDKGILARQDTLHAFRFRLNRAGLKKPLHNRK